MLVALLDSAGVVTSMEVISAKGLAEGYRPQGTWVKAQPEWERGGTVVDGVYTAPPPPDWAAIDAGVLNAALSSEGSIVRALGLVTFAEINKLRVKNGDAEYTLQQFKTALKAQMR